MSPKKKYIFRNSKTYAIMVPTPSGAGRMMQPGDYVEGDYFIQLANKGLLEVMPEDLKYPASKLVCSAYRTEITNRIVEAIQAESHYAENTIQNRLQRQPNVVEEVKDIPPIPIKSMNIEESFIDAMRQTNQLLPTPEEVNAMPTPVLKALASKLGVAYIIPRTAFVKAIKTRLKDMR